MSELESDFYNLVKEFNIAIKAPSNAELRASLIREEASEAIDAVDFKDIIAFIDGMCDLLYVDYGALHSLFPEEKLTTKEIVLEQKNNSFIDSELSPAILDNRHLCKIIKTVLGWSAVIEKSHLEQPSTIKELINHHLTILNDVGIPIRPFFLEVHRTNMLKLTGPIREDGKQLKPYGWRPPRISSMYNRMRAGNPPIHDISCNGGECKKPLEHPEGGLFCEDCGGLIITY